MATTPTEQPPATRADIRRLEQLIDDLQVAIDKIARDQKVQFTRIAQIQADIDLVRGVWSKLRTPDLTDPTYAGPERRRRKTR